MQVTVNLYAGLEIYISTGQRKNNIIIVDKSATLQDLLKKMGIPEEKVKLILVNGRSQESTYHLNDQDTIGLFPPIGGG